MVKLRWVIWSTFAGFLLGAFCSWHLKAIHDIAIDKAILQQLDPDIPSANLPVIPPPPPITQSSEM